ncbi:MAG: hypothetical protein H7Y20_12815 [Bryobacteraceae bacterium]|nr:hypothetical protein [Bryobacteraceae bacterium]
MFTRSNFVRFAFLAALGCVGTAVAQQGTRLDPRSTMHITLPEDSPVTVVSADWGESTATARGGAMLLDLHTSLSLRNSGGRKIRGVTLLVQAQEVSPGGKASVSVPSLNVPAGENFPVRVDLRLLRPLQSGNGPLVEIQLDGVLFDDLSFYGPNRLNSRRSMTIWELEARRDRQHFRAVLEARGKDALRSEMLSSLDRQADRMGMDARVVQSGRSTTGRNERQIELAFLDAPGAPITTDGGIVRISDNEARSPKMSLRSRTDRPVRGVEMGWLLKDTRGREFVAGAVPMDINLQPRQKTSLVQDVTLRFTQPGGAPIPIQDMTAYLASIEFADGTMWVPERNSKWPTPSPEEQRLTEVYRKRGVDALVQELERFR